MTDIALDEKALDAAQKALYTAWSSGDYDEAGPMAAAAVTAYLEAEAAEARADALAQEVQRLSKALGDAERRLVSLYDGIAPQAHYENELGINGHRTGNRHADNDEVVQRIRSALGERP